MVAQNQVSKQVLLIILLLNQYLKIVQSMTGCDINRIQSELIVPNGTFASSNYGHGLYGPNLQCIYTFISNPGYRVKVNFEHFDLTGSSSRCAMDYVDIYSELSNPNSLELVRVNMSGRYCGSVSPRTRVSLHNMIILVFHTRSNTPGATGFAGTFEFITEERYMVGTPMSGKECAFTITATSDRSGSIISPTYPGAYPKNYYCWYWLSGMKGQRIRIFLNDFDLYFGGVHCPYDALTIYDGATNRAPIMTKMCGMQQAKTMYSVSNNLFIELNTTNPPAAEHRGFQIDYEFSSSLVDVERLIGGESGVNHMRGTECDVRVKSNVETKHWIQSPNFPGMYPAHTTCIYIIDGLQGVENLEKVYLTFETFNIPTEEENNEITEGQSDAEDNGDSKCEGNYLGVYRLSESVAAALKAQGGPVNGPMDLQLQSAPLLYSAFGGNTTRTRVKCSTPYFGGVNVPLLKTIESDGARMLLVFKAGEADLPAIRSNKAVKYGFRSLLRFETVLDCSCSTSSLALYLSGNDWTDANTNPDLLVCANHWWHGPVYADGARIVLKFQTKKPVAHGSGFRAVIDFRTDFGIPGEPISGQNKCAFRFESGRTKQTTIHSPRFPANYPLATNCTYYMVGKVGQRVRLYFEQFKLSRGRSPVESCNDYLLIYDVRSETSDADARLSAKYCPAQEPGPLVSALGFRMMKLIFVSDSHHADTGFKAAFDFRTQPQTDIPGENPALVNCGGIINDAPAGYIKSPLEAYGKDWVCTWEIRVRRGYRVLLRHDKEIQVEGTMLDGTSQCMVTVVRVWANGPSEQFTNEMCGTVSGALPVIYSKANVLRVSFLTSPQRVNSLAGFNFTWTRLRDATGVDACKPEELRCDGSQPHFCIDQSLKCNMDPNCGPNDRTDEVNCNLDDSDSHGLGVQIAVITGTCMITLICLLGGCVLAKRHMQRKFTKNKNSKRAQRRANKTATPSNVGGSMHATPAREFMEMKHLQPQSRMISA